MRTLLIIALCLSLMVSSCSSFPGITGEATAETTTSSLFSKLGISLLTTGAVEALTYKAIKSNPKSESTFEDIADAVSSISEDNMLTADEVKSLIKARLEAVNSKYRTYAMLALDVVFNSFASTEKQMDYDISKYRNILNAIVLGINSATDLVAEENAREAESAAK